MNEGGHQRRISYRLLLAILWATLLVLAIEVTAGWVSHSLSLLAEALHTLIDVFSTSLSLIAVASPQRTLGREIWGHGRGEAAGALLLAAILGFSNLTLLLLAIGQLQGLWQQSAVPFPVEITITLIQLVTAMVVITLGLALLSAYQNRTLGSLALRLNSQHLLQDAWLTASMLLGLVAIWRGYGWVDPLVAIALVGFSIRSFWRMLLSQLPMLLRPTAIAPEAIAQVAGQVEGVTRCTRILSRGMVGRQVWVELHIALHPEFASMASVIGERVENALRQQYGPLRAKIWVEKMYTPMEYMPGSYQPEPPPSP
ncbi:cation diffusion facilitator family transporter [Romeria aff. gracilis LEGE 07310]|uniref:Cation diffusion facilitator family transporter n=1 Tax=Vasconcelosia minhoensis LEGE 07310 TaxID=915328 RepID=A0A8J7AMJ5_9CYAN|nr:cation diffusion facilitator family transporter [Romeria gracilis]MBE9077056.1 cation diffusion facilitator family transporter [Romeria aff. gracilis LEGE 07310]